MLDGVLHIQQTDDADPVGEGAGVAPHLVHLLLGDEIRREHACRVAVESSVSMLHDAADDAAMPVGNRVHVRFERVLGKWSISTGCPGATRSAWAKNSRIDSASYTICIARPHVQGRISTGQPIFSASRTASS